MMMQAESDVDIPKESKIIKSLIFGNRIYCIICEVSELPLCSDCGNMKTNVYINWWGRQLQRRKQSEFNGVLL